ncbi:DUF5689 domain-containing protein [Myroides fluvii]|uniref:DUF5689 domain-containing protein n=1 Tax=Myroides fluvii TaxID=2572594 RepID=UPI00131BD138|nr:DUF5689 domain-containing protein [Myroides fluvii]
MKTKQKTTITLIFYALLLSSCAKNDNFSLPTLDCMDPTLVPTTTLENLQNLADAAIRLYPGDERDALAGLVISSDQGGNFYNKLYIVDEITHRPAIINLDMSASFTEFPPGTKVVLALGELYCNYAYGKLAIGGGIYTSSNGKKYIGSIAKNAISKSIQKYCELVDLEPYTTTLPLEALKNETEKYTGQLVRLENVQFDRKLVGKKLYDPLEVDAQGYTLRRIVDQQGNSLYIRTGKLTKDFADYTIPSESGSLIGIIDVFSKQIQFFPRILEDIHLDQPPFGDIAPNPEGPDDVEHPEEETDLPVEPGQSLAFSGADFENWEDFIAVLKRPGLKFALAAPGEGWNNSTGLVFRGSPTTTDNAFTIKQVQVPSNATALSFLLKGTANAKSLAIALYQDDGAYVAYNLEHLTTSKVILPTSHTNQEGNVYKYKGVINTNNQWIKVILSLENVRYNTTGEGDFLTFRFSGKTATIPSDYDLILDEIRFEQEQLVE